MNSVTLTISKRPKKMVKKKKKVTRLKASSPGSVLRKSPRRLPRNASPSSRLGKSPSRKSSAMAATNLRLSPKPSYKRIPTEASPIRSKRKISTSKKLTPSPSKVRLKKKKVASVSKASQNHTRKMVYISLGVRKLIPLLDEDLNMLKDPNTISFKRHEHPILLKLAFSKMLVISQKME